MSCVKLMILLVLCFVCCGVHAADAVTIDSASTTTSKVLRVTDTTDSTNKDSGSLQIDGGAGIEKNLNVGGDVVVSGETAVSSTTTSTDKDTGALVVEGGVGIEEDLNVGGDVKVEGSLTQQDLIYVYATNATAQSISGTVTNLAYSTEVEDDSASWGTDTFTAPRDGLYRVEATSSANITVAYSLGIWINGTHKKYGATAERTTYSIIEVSGVFRLSQNDTLTIRSSYSGTRYAYATHNQIQIVEIR